MVSTLAGAAANIILDPIFIFAFHWGMMGAAVATVIGQVLTDGRTLVLDITSFLSQISLVAATYRELGQKEI